MFTEELHTTTSIGLREHVRRLERERATASLNGLADNSLYMAHLGEELASVRAAYVGAAVTDIASLRAALDAPLLG